MGVTRPRSTSARPPSSTTPTPPSPRSGRGTRSARHEPSGTWLAFDHASATAVLRDRRLGRIWRDREPAAALEPFNLLHRHQMIGERAARAHPDAAPRAGAFQRGPSSGSGPRVRELAARCWPGRSRRLRRRARHAEPLPVLVIAELGVPTEHAPSLRAWSQAIGGCTRSTRRPPWSRPPWPLPSTSPPSCAPLVALRRRLPREDLVSDLAADRPDRRRGRGRRGLLLNAGHEASVNVFGNGLVSMLRAGLRPATDVARTVEESCATTGAAALRRTATRRSSSARSRSAEGSRRPPCWVRPPRPRASRTPTRSSPTATRTRTSPSAAACTAAWARRGADGAGESLRRAGRDLPRPGAGGRAREPRHVRAPRPPRRPRAGLGSAGQPGRQVGAVAPRTHPPVGGGLGPASSPADSCTHASGSASTTFGRRPAGVPRPLDALAPRRTAAPAARRGAGRELGQPLGQGAAAPSATTGGPARRQDRGDGGASASARAGRGNGAADTVRGARATDRRHAVPSGRTAESRSRAGTADAAGVTSPSTRLWSR